MITLLAAADAATGISRGAAGALAAGVVGLIAYAKRRWLIGIICTIISVGCILQTVHIPTSEGPTHDRSSASTTRC